MYVGIGVSYVGVVFSVPFSIPLNLNVSTPGTTLLKFVFLCGRVSDDAFVCGESDR